MKEAMTHVVLSHEWGGDSCFVTTITDLLWLARCLRTKLRCFVFVFVFF